VNSRKVLETVLRPLGVTGELFPPVCVIVDKLDKLSEDEVVRQLEALGLKKNVITTIQKTLTLKSLAELKQVLPADSDILKDFEELWRLADAYGYADFLVFDASVVRGLAYYTGIVFECFDRSGTLRAIAGGGRYDKLLSTYGAKEDVPMVGFGFGDIVIVELLKDKGLLPPLEQRCDDVVIAFDEALRPAAYRVAQKLREKGRCVDVQLIPGKKIPWSYDYANRVGADRTILLGPAEWEKGMVRVKDMKRGARDEAYKGEDVKLEDL